MAIVRPITATQIRDEFGGTNPVPLSDYYAGGGLVPPGTVGANGPIPESGTIKYGDFEGAAGTDPYDAKILTYTGNGGPWYYIGDKFTGSTNTIEELNNKGVSNGALLAYDGGTLNDTVVTRPVANKFAARFPSQPDNWQFNAVSTSPVYRGQSISIINDNCLVFGYVKPDNGTFPLNGGLGGLFNPTGGTATQSGWRMICNLNGQQRVFINQAGNTNTTYTSIGPTPFPNMPNGGHVIIRVAGANSFMMVNGVYYSAANAIPHTATSSANIIMDARSLGAQANGVQFHRFAYLNQGLSQAQMTELYNLWIGTLASTRAAIDVTTLGIDPLDSSTWPEEPLPDGVQLTNIPAYLQTYWNTGIKP